MGTYLFLKKKEKKNLRITPYIAHVIFFHLHNNPFRASLIPLNKRVNRNSKILKNLPQITKLVIGGVQIRAYSPIKIMH